MLVSFTITITAAFTATTSWYKRHFKRFKHHVKPAFPDIRMKCAVDASSTGLELPKPFPPLTTFEPAITQSPLSRLACRHGHSQVPYSPLADGGYEHSLTFEEVWGTQTTKFEMYMTVSTWVTERYLDFHCCPKSQSSIPYYPQRPIPCQVSSDQFFR